MKVSETDIEGLKIIDPELKIGLGKDIILSDKDRQHKMLYEIEPYEEGE